MGSRKTGRKSYPNQTLLIGDDLLIEILSRIPTPVAAIRCKLVCKGWCSLISSFYFISRFKQQHIKHESRYPKPLSGMLAYTGRRVNIAEDSDFNFRGFNLDYLPNWLYGNIEVVASCNDLIICEDRKLGSSKCNKYYLCNPFTMQWIALPSPPAKPVGWTIRIGLVCQPYNRGDPFRYRVVRICYYDEYDSIDCHHSPGEMYCSETCKWIRCDGLDKYYFLPESKIAAYNGKLYWVNRGGEYLIRYDPFEKIQTPHRLINGPNSGYHCSRVGECEGVLRVMRFERWQPGGYYKKISLWELQEEEVIFKEHILLNEDILGSHPNLIANIVGFHPRNKDNIVGFHPRNKDVLFLEIRNSLASFNMKTRELKVETKPFPPLYSYPYRYAFPLQLPWWPTPILSLSPTPTL